MDERTCPIAIPARLPARRIVDRFLDFLVSEGSIPSNPLAELRARCAQHNTAPVATALLADAPDAAIEALKPMPRFTSFLGDLMRHHIDLMRAVGYRYTTQAERLARFDRFLQRRPDLRDEALPILLQQWRATRPTLEHAWQCQHLGRDPATAWQRVDPSITIPPVDQYLARQITQQRRHPYVYTAAELRHLLDTARQFPSPRTPLRPLTLYTMLLLGCCAGLRLGEIVRLDLDDVDLTVGQIAIRETKFFKSRTLPLANSVLAALRAYIKARRQRGAPQDGTSGLFWHAQRAGRYSYMMTGVLLVRVRRRAGVKPARGRVGPRTHDLRHAFVVHRMLQWYREGINPQTRLPYLAAYLGHKDINSTLVYLTVTQELLQHTSERFRAFACCRNNSLSGAVPSA